MDTNWHTGVVVGVDGSPQSLTALDWAVSAADRHHAELTAIIAYGTPTNPYPTGPVPTAEERHAAAEEVVRRATGRLAGVRPGGHPVKVSAAPSSPVDLLVARSRASDLVVVGRRGLNGLNRLMLGSVSSAVAARAHGPVVVVPDGAGTGGPRRVVVGVDLPYDAAPALEHAFAEADVAGCELDVVHAPDVSPIGDALREYESFGMARRSETQAALEQEVRRWSEKFPAVPVSMSVRDVPAASALLQATTPADLLVVGGRRHHRVTGRIFGSVTDRVVRESSCAVMVVKEG